MRIPSRAAPVQSTPPPRAGLLTKLLSLADDVVARLNQRQKVGSGTQLADVVFWVFFVAICQWPNAQARAFKDSGSVQIASAECGNSLQLIPVGNV